VTLLETGQTVRWRGSRWRVIGEEEGGFLRLVGIDAAVKDLQVTPLVELEADGIRPDELPLPELDVEASDRGRWRALHRAYLTSMAGGREQLVGLDWGAVAVEPYQLVPLLRPGCRPPHRRRRGRAADGGLHVLRLVPPLPARLLEPGTSPAVEPL